MMTVALILTYRWAVFGLLGLLLLVQLYGWFMKKNAPRRNLRLGLNLLLFLVLVLFVLNPGWESKQGDRKVVIYSDEISPEVRKQLSDSLGAGIVISTKEFSKKWDTYKGKVIILLGKGFTAEDLSRLSGENVVWKPAFRSHEIQDIHWSAVLRKGENQVIKGQIQVDKESELKLMLGHQVLDSVVLQAGLQSINLTAMATAEGRNQWELVLNDESLLTIRFYAEPLPELNVLMLRDFPDMESRMLSEWLGRQGNQIAVLTKVAKDEVFQSEVNQKEKKADADLIIAPPTYHNDPSVRRAVATGRSVLFYGFERLPEQLTAINKSLGTGFRTERISGAEEVNLGGELTAQPFRFLVNQRQKYQSDINFAWENRLGKVGVSGLNETFPLQLSGDSLRYNKIWTEMLAPFYPVDSGRVVINGPVNKDVVARVIINPGYHQKTLLETGQDTVQTRSSLINADKKTADYTFRKPGWQKLNHVEVFVEEDNALAYLKQWMRENSNLTQNISNSPVEKHLPDWLWFLIILSVLGAVWVEAKL